MKNLLTFLLLFVFIINCQATEDDTLPKVPWKCIVETYNTRQSSHWEKDIRIKLFGNYSAADSVLVANSIKQLNVLCETIQLSFSKSDRGNLELYFLDSLNAVDYEQIITLASINKSNWTYTHIDTNGIGHFSQFYNTHLISDEYKQNYLTNTLAFALYPTFWRGKEYERDRLENKEVANSIFRVISIEKREELLNAEMQNFDKKLLQEIYSTHFAERYEKAKRQYKTFVKIPDRFKNNARAFLILPFAILLLLLFPVFMKLTKVIARKVPNKLLSFNFSGIIGLVVVVLIVSFYFSLAEAIKYDLFDRGVLYSWMREGFLTALVVGLASINILRFIELLIKKNTHKKVLKTVFVFLSTGLIPFFSVLIIVLLSKKYRGITFWEKEEIDLITNFFIACITVASFRALVGYFFFKEKDLILENETKLSKLRELKTKAELNALHSRINPHFLYNSLNSIAGLANIDANKTEQMALSLSKLFRYSINKEKSDWTSFKEELEMVKIYLDVEKIRFKERLSYSVEITPDLEEQKIPRFIIQPLVENAVKHGISKSIEGGAIKVCIFKEGKSTIIYVSDSGPAFPDDFTPGFGIQSIYDKLEILYNNKFEMSFTNEPLKKVTLKLN